MTRLLAIFSTAACFLFALDAVIETPTGACFVALAFAALALLTVIIIVFREKPVVLVEDKPKDFRATSKVLKLSNELAPYVKEKDGKIYIKVVK